MDQLKAIRDALEVRIRIAQTFVTLGGTEQARAHVRQTWHYLAEVGQMFERKLRDPSK